MKRRGNREGTIRQRADGRWTAQIRIIDPLTGLAKRVQVYGRTRTDALDALNLVKNRVARGEPSTYDRVTLRDLMERWLADVAAPNVRPNVLGTYSSAARMHLYPELGHFDLATIRPASIEHVLCGSGATGSARTREIALMILKAAFKTAVRWKMIASNPAEGIAAPKRMQREIHPMTPRQLHAFLNAAAPRRLFALYAFAAFTGARIGEILALRWLDVDLVAGTARIAGSRGRDGDVGPTKTRRSRRTVRLTPDLRDALVAHGGRMKAEGHGSPFVFVAQTGAPLYDRNVLRDYKETLIAAGLAQARERNGQRIRGATLEQSFRLQDLRHTYATLALAAGVPLKVVSEQLGHATITLTADTYMHVMPAMQDEAAAALGTYYSTAILTAISANSAS